MKVHFSLFSSESTRLVRLIKSENPDNQVIIRIYSYPDPEPTVKFPPREKGGPVHISTLLDPILEISSHPDRNRLLVEFFNR